MPTRAYFTGRAKALAKQLLPPKPKPIPQPSYRPITGHRAQELKIKIRKIRKKHKKRFVRYRKPKRTYVQLVLTEHERNQWGRAAQLLHMNVSELMRVAMRRLLSSKRHLNAVNNGAVDAFLVKSISPRTLQRRILREFGIKYKETEHLIVPKKKILNNHTSRSTSDGDHPIAVSETSGVDSSSGSVQSLDQSMLREKHDLSDPTVLALPTTRRPRLMVGPPPRP